MSYFKGKDLLSFAAVHSQSVGNLLDMVHNPVLNFEAASSQFVGLVEALRLAHPILGLKWACASVEEADDALAAVDGMWRATSCALQDSVHFMGS